LHDSRGEGMLFVTLVHLYTMLTHVLVELSNRYFNIDK